MILNNDLEILIKTDKLSYSDDLFGIKKRVKVRHFSKKTQLVPEINKSYIFDETTTPKTTWITPPTTKAIKGNTIPTRIFQTIQSTNNAKTAKPSRYNRYFFILNLR